MAMDQPLFVIALVAALIFAILYFKARSDIRAAAEEQYNRWRQEDLDRITHEQRAIAVREAAAHLHTWRQQQEAGIREDAITRSKAVIIGKVTEHVAPWLPVFPYNPKDARFIGSPIDMIVFDGCDEDDVRSIVFLEIKTSSSTLSRRQRQIRDAILAGRVEWQELRIDSSSNAVLK
jgi:predicted Holliday junction resolvase-like endonuclease